LGVSLLHAAFWVACAPGRSFFAPATVSFCATATVSFFAPVL
jgi:hypothetical protein